MHVLLNKSRKKLGGENRMGKSREERIEISNRIAEEVENDPGVAKRAEEDQKRNNAAAGKDIVFTI